MRDLFYCAASLVYEVLLLSCTRDLCCNTPLINKESFVHLFRMCPFTSNLLINFLNRYRITLPENSSSFNDTYWYGLINQELHRPTLLLFDSFRYSIWHFKIRKIAPNPSGFDRVINGLLDDIFSKKPSILESFRNTQHLSFFASMFQARG